MQNPLVVIEVRCGKCGKLLAEVCVKDQGCSDQVGTYCDTCGRVPILLMPIIQAPTND